MDLAPELFESVTFREKWRGYDPDDVDDFLERVAVSISDLQERLREANDRVERAEHRAREKVDADESMKRTLVIAQRTADQVLGEADDEATRIVESAREEAAVIVRRAEHDAVRMADEAQRRLRDDLRALERARDRLRTDVAALERFVDGERARLKEELQARLAEIDDPATLRLGAAPDAREVEIPPAPVVAEDDHVVDGDAPPAWRHDDTAADDTPNGDTAHADAPNGDTTDDTPNGDTADDEMARDGSAPDDDVIDATAAHRPFDIEDFGEETPVDDVSEPAVLHLRG